MVSILFLCEFIFLMGQLLSDAPEQGQEMGRRTHSREQSWPWSSEPGELGQIVAHKPTHWPANITVWICVSLVLTDGRLRSNIMLI